MASILLDENSLIMIAPVTLDGEGEVANVGLPTQVTLGELRDWIIEQIPPAE